MFVQYDQVFVHDCDDCVFLGHVHGNDLFMCENGGSIVRRFGHDSADYLSGIVLVEHDEILCLALGLALVRDPSFIRIVSKHLGKDV